MVDAMTSDEMTATLLLWGWEQWANTYGKRLPDGTFIWANLNHMQVHTFYTGDPATLVRYKLREINDICLYNIFTVARRYEEGEIQRVPL